MNRFIAQLSRWLGYVTVLVAFAAMLWSIAEQANESSTPFPAGPGPNPYVAIIAAYSSIAVSGMLAVGLGFLLEHFDEHA